MASQVHVASTLIENQGRTSLFVGVSTSPSSSTCAPRTHVLVFFEHGSGFAGKIWRSQWDMASSHLAYLSPFFRAFLACVFVTPYVSFSGPACLCHAGHVFLMLLQVVCHSRGALRVCAFWAQGSSAETQ